MYKRLILKDWKTKVGLRAIILKTSMGHLCGYVGVDKNNVLYKKSYSENIDKLLPLFIKAKKRPIGKRGIIPIFTWDGKTSSMDIVFDVHGSVTYSGEGKHFIKSNLWWIGFDTAHAGDTIEKCNLDYCIKECESFAKQIISIEK